MSDEALTAAANDAVQPSQILTDTGADPNAQGKGVAIPEDAKPEKLSTRDAIAKAFDEATSKAKEAQENAKEVLSDKEAKAKAEGPEKAEEKPAKLRDGTGKFTRADKPAEQEVKAERGAPEQAAAERSAPEEPRQSEGRKYAEPPARFLPDARTKWANVPNEVKAEFHRVSQEMEQEVTRYKASAERYEAFRQYDEIAKQNGRDFATDTLPRIVQFENMMRQNPIAALDFALREAGPRKADGSPVSLYELAQVVMQRGPQSSAPQMMAPQAQALPEVDRLKQELEELKMQIVAQPLQQVVERFAAEHDDYHALEPQIEKILRSGVIEQLYGTGLSPEQKLMQAYRMAGGLGPSSRSEPEPVPQHSDAVPTARPVDPDGQKSIRGAPTAGQTGKPAWVPKSNREALERAFASVR